MNGSSYLLDTNIVAAVLNQEPTIEGQLKGKSVYLCSIALGELYFGAYKSTRVSENLKRIADFVDHYPILTCDQVTAEHYGQTKLALRQKGRPIPEMTSGSLRLLCNMIWYSSPVMSISSRSMGCHWKPGNLPFKQESV